MKNLLTLLLFLLSTQVQAQSVRVTSGEHEGFSRLVLTMPESNDWAFGRVEDGYALTLKSGNPRYDLSDVYRRLTRARLVAIFSDPQTGQLKLGIQCVCHAMPFELRPGQIVIDIRDGAAPEGSSFETALDGSSLPPLAPRPILRPKERPKGTVETAGIADLDWQEITQKAAQLPALPMTPLPISETGQTDLSQVRKALIWQLSKGASEGVVEMAKPMVPDQIDAKASSYSQIRIGAEAGVDPNSKNREDNRMTAEGMTCLPDSALNILDWGGPGPVSGKIGIVLSNLVGEFDRPDPEAISTAVKFFLHLGFGAEARQILAGLEIASPNRALWETLAHILDGDDMTGSVFAGMEVCDTAAALWSVLASTEIPKSDNIAIPAILRNFSGLPLHLRTHLGPTLADRFLARDDIPTSRAIRDAILRAPGDHGNAVDLLAAKIAMATGQHEAGEARLEDLSNTSGPESIEATIALALLQTEEGKQTSADVTTALEAYFQEAKDSQSETNLRAALALAYASQDRFEDAFAMSEDQNTAAKPIWERLALFGSDSNLIQFAILPQDAKMPALTNSVDQHLAERLLDLGFASSAVNWLDSARRNAGVQTDEDRVLLAETALQLRDARQALRHVAGLNSEKADLLRARALTLLNDASAAENYAKTSETQEWLVSARRRQNWDEVSMLSPTDTWGAAVALLDVNPTNTQPPIATDTSQSGPLGRGKDILSESRNAREILATLLAESAVENLVN